MRRPTAIAAIVGALVLAWPAVAVADTLDATSTQTFLTAAIPFERAAIARHGQEVAAIDALIGHVQSACPDAVPANLAAGSPAQQHTLGAFRDAALLELSLAALRPVKSAARIEIAHTAKLRWTNATLNKRFAAYIREGRALLALRAPDLCVQARAAAQSDFAAVPPRTKAFIARYRAAAPNSAPTLAGLAHWMKPFATPAERASIERLHALEAKFERVLSAKFLLGAFGRVEQALTGELTI
ncbi:MAG TPA: hypothetical protein VMB27_03380 [Solirubrobacteraceae bacterium]|nr:hypothetical protein [Solirubrobacteraceae bacterium]